MLLSTKGVVLQSIKYGDSSLISKVFSQEKGLLSIISNRSKGKKNKSINYLQPLGMVNFVCYHTNKSTIHRLKEISFQQKGKFNDEDVVKSAIRFFLAEFLCVVIKEEEQNQELYSFLEDKIRELISLESSQLGNFPIRFLIDFLVHLGIYPNIDSNDRYFDLVEGSSTTITPNHNSYFENRQWSLFMSSVTSVDHLKKMERNELLDLLLIYYNVQLGGGLEHLKSKSVLEMVFS